MVIKGKAANNWNPYLSNKMKSQSFRGQPMDSWSLALGSLKPTANFPYSQQPSEPLSTLLAHFTSLVRRQRSQKALVHSGDYYRLEDASSVITAAV